MTKLEEEFEATGYSAWINADIYPGGKIHTKEYTEWLEKKVESLTESNRAEIEEAFDMGANDAFLISGGNESVYRSPADYYEKAYGSEAPEKVKKEGV